MMLVVNLYLACTALVLMLMEDAPLWSEPSDEGEASRTEQG